MASAGPKLSGEGTSVPELLRLVGDGANGPILMALGPRSLRTKKLTEKVPSYSPRTIYRHARRLAELGLIDREEVAGVPSTVIHSLSPAGRDLYRLLDDFCKTAPAHLPAPAGGDGVWKLCGLLGEMLASGWMEELGYGGRSTTDLAEATPDLTFHQAGRRTHQLVSWSLLYESATRGRKRYQLSDEARYCAVLVATLGRWRQRHVVGKAEGGLEVGEMATILRGSLPLIELPDHREMTIRLGIVGGKGSNGKAAAKTLTGHVSVGGSVHCVRDREAADAWALGTVEAWLAALLDGDASGLREGGERGCVEDCLERLHEALCPPQLEAAAR